MGALWLSGGRALESKPRLGLSLRKTHSSLLSTVSTQEDLSPA